MQHLYICLISWGWLAFAHPFFLSLTEIRYNESSQKLEIAEKIFWDDLEVSLAKFHNTSIDVLNPKDKKLLDKQITEYLLAHNKVWVNNAPVKLNVLGYEVEEEAIWFYLESEPTQFENSIKVENTVLLSDHDSQQNIVHVYVEGNSPKSMLLRKDHESEILEF
jgi:hypothetical protein